MERKLMENGLWALITDIGEVYAIGGYEEITQMWENCVWVDCEYEYEDEEEMYDEEY